MRNIWFTADTHFGHKGIIEFCNRPYSSVEDMDEDLIKKWNEIVDVTDFVYHLGDFAWCKIGEYCARLNGFIHLVRGSHDKQIGNACSHFTSVQDLLDIKIEDQRITLCHYAMRTWNASHSNSWQLFGHSHGRLISMDKQIDVGVDTHYFYPYSWEEIKTIMRNKKESIYV